MMQGQVNAPGPQKIDLKQLKEELKSLPWSKCRELMMHLGTEKYELDMIEEDHSGRERRKEEAFDSWLKKDSCDWIKIICALEKIDENILAKKLSKYDWKDPRVQSARRFIQLPFRATDHVCVKLAEDTQYCRAHIGPPSTNCDYYTVDVKRGVPPSHITRHILPHFADRIKEELANFLSKIEESEYKNDFRVGYEIRYGRVYYSFQKGSENNSAQSVRDFVPNLRQHKKTTFVADIKRDDINLSTLLHESKKCSPTIYLIDPLKFEVIGQEEGLYIAVVHEIVPGRFMLKAVYRQPTDQKNSAKYDVILPGKKYDIRIGDNCGPLVEVDKKRLCYKIAEELTESMRRESDDRQYIVMNLRGEKKECRYFVRFFRQKSQEQYYWKKWIIAKYEVDTFPEVRGETDATEKFPPNTPFPYQFDRKLSRLEIELWNQKKYPKGVDATKPDRGEYQKMECIEPIHFAGEPPPVPNSSLDY